MLSKLCDLPYKFVNELMQNFYSFHLTSEAYGCKAVYEGKGIQAGFFM